MDDVTLLLTLAERHPRLAAVAVAVVALGVVVVGLAQVYPSAEWCRAHPRLFAALRFCRVLSPWLIKGAERAREVLSTPRAEAAVAKAFGPASSSPPASPDPPGGKV